MTALLRSPRWIGFTAIALVAIIGFGLLSRWQWQRAEEHRIERLTIEQGEQVQGLVTNISDLDPFSRVDVQGTYVDRYTTLVRQRPQDGSNGYWVVTPLDASGKGDFLWVVRGWVPASTNALERPVIEPAPAGSIRITGVVREFEDPRSDVSGLPMGVVSRMSVEELPAIGPIQNRALQVVTSAPSEGITAVDLPTVDEGQNISYAVQWIIFAIIATGGWFIFLRREAQEVAQSQNEADLTE